ncbi:MAG: hypothetical protein NUV34_06575 [Sulfuricaulis sp.]|nr:hypothetical protein [Sulfuricaulis sp.]
MATFETKIAGIPCLVRYNRLPAIRGARERGVPMEPDVSDGFEILGVLDPRGRPAPWLEAKLTSAETDRIVDQIMEGR